MKTTPTPLDRQAREIFGIRDGMRAYTDPPKNEQGIYILTGPGFVRVGSYYENGFFFMGDGTHAHKDRLEAIDMEDPATLAICLNILAPECLITGRPGEYAVVWGEHVMGRGTTKGEAVVAASKW